MKCILVKYCHLNKFLYIKHHEVIISENKSRGLLSWLKTSSWYEEKSWGVECMGWNTPTRISNSINVRSVRNKWGGVAGLFFAFNSASGRHMQWIRLSRTAMSYRIEHQNSNQRGFERWPFGFYVSVHLGIQQVQAFTKTKQERLNKINIILVVGLRQWSVRGLRLTSKTFLGSYWRYSKTPLPF